MKGERMEEETYNDPAKAFSNLYIAWSYCHRNEAPLLSLLYSISSFPLLQLSLLPTKLQALISFPQDPILWAHLLSPPTPDRRLWPLLYPRHKSNRQVLLERLRGLLRRRALGRCVSARPLLLRVPPQCLRRQCESWSSILFVFLFFYFLLCLLGN